MDAVELSRIVKSRMAEMGLDEKVAAFLTWDVIGAFDSIESMGREIEDLEGQVLLLLLFRDVSLSCPLVFGQGVLTPNVLCNERVEVNYPRIFVR
ncbi:unnamed protein product [Ectocarpus fasciculatus]